MNVTILMENIRHLFGQITNMPIYDFINWFFLFSMFGYVLECIVLSLENKKLITNRGFVHGPFCVIYGCCAIIATVILSPLIGSPVLLYFASAALATTAELITANIMIRLFGAFWWDYSKKPFNYKGIICLESSIGWGFLGLFFFYFLSGFMLGIVHLLPVPVSKVIAFILTVYYVVDFSICTYRRVNGTDSDADKVGRLKVTR